jgi:WD40 repeat protein
MAIHMPLGGLIRTFRGHRDAVCSVAIAPDGRTALSGSFDKTLKLWDLSSGHEIRTFQGHTDRVASVAVAPDGSTFALSGSSDQTLKLWDLSSGNEIRTFQVRRSKRILPPRWSGLCTWREAKRRNICRAGAALRPTRDRGYNDLDIITGSPRDLVDGAHSAASRCQSWH